MSKLYAGTSGWAYASWKPRFYPPKLASGKFLSHYAARLNTVEVNYTFRHFATEKTQTNWIACTPPDFKFSIKAHQNITHIRRLRDAAEITRSFLASLQPLASAGKIAMVLFQLPPFLKADPPLLSDFLSGLPKAGRFSFEFRPASWFSEPIFQALRDAYAALCLAGKGNLGSP